MVDGAVQGCQPPLDFRDEFAVGDQNPDEEFHRSELINRAHTDHETTITKGNPGQIRRRRVRFTGDSSQAATRSTYRRAPSLPDSDQAVSGTEERAKSFGCNASLRACALESRYRANRRR